MASWETMLLDKIGAPQSSTNQVALAEWAQSEGMPASANNPLAAEDQISGSKPTPGFSAPTYPSLDAATTLYANKFETLIYADIGLALREGADLNVIWQAINKSPWCAGCQGGTYPVVLYNTLQGNTTQAPALPRATGPTTPYRNQVSGAWMRLMRTLAITAPKSLRAQAKARARLNRAVR